MVLAITLSLYLVLSHDGLGFFGGLPRLRFSGSVVDGCGVMVVVSISFFASESSSTDF